MLESPRTATLLKRDFNTGFVLWILWIIQKHLFCVEDLWTTGSQTPVCASLRTPLFTEHLQRLLLTVTGFQPATLLKKRLQQRRFSVNFAKFIGTSFDWTPLGDCFLCLSVNLEKFLRSPFLQTASGKLLISCTSYRISTTRHNKKSFTSAFQASYTKTRRSYSKVFLYLKSLKIICE